MVHGPLSAPKPQHARDITERIALRLCQLREERGITADDLADRSGVSRSMIYRIESGQASPTAVVLNKLATGLGVLLPTLLGPGDYREPRLNLRHPVVSRKAQATWVDPDTGYSRRTLTPTTADARMQLSEIHFPAGARVTFENAFGEVTVHQQIWLLEGADGHPPRGRDSASAQRRLHGDDTGFADHLPQSRRKGFARYLVAITRSGK